MLYTKYLNIIKAVEEAIPEWPVLDANEREILDMLAMKWNNETGHITVLEAMGLLPNVSASTMHKRISALVNKDVIKLEAVTGDRRIKMVMPTKLTLRYFDDLAISFDNVFPNTYQK